MEYKVSLNPYDIDQRLMMFHKETLGFTTCDKITTILKENHDVQLQCEIHCEGCLKLHD